MSKVDINEILDFMPHRYPMLLIDKIEEVNENSVIAKKNITFNVSTATIVYSSSYSSRC